ncbi:hypothetical protein NUACC26_027830 [Scytonema sp. NUACC26]
MHADERKRIRVYARLSAVSTLIQVVNAQDLPIEWFFVTGFGVVFEYLLVCLGNLYLQ